MFAPRRWVIPSLCAVAVISFGKLRGGEVSDLVSIPPVFPSERVVAQGDDVPPPPVVPDPEENPNTEDATEKPVGGLSLGSRNQLVSALVGAILAERILDKDKSDDRIRAEIKRKAKLLFARIREPQLPIPASGDVSLDEEQDKEVEGLLTLAFESAGAPISEMTPPASSPLITIEPFIPTIFRVAKDYYDNTLLKDTSLTPDVHKARLSSLIKQKMSGLSDLGPESLERQPVEDLIGSITEAVIAGKPAPTLPARASRLTSENLRALLDALKAKSKELAIEGSNPKSFNHKQQLIDLGVAKAKELAKIQDDLKPEEASEVEGLVNQARDPRLVVAPPGPEPGVAPPGPEPDATPPRPEPDAIPIAADLKNRIQHLLRQINHALAAVGFDSNARKSVLTRFVRERFSTAAGQANELADEILQETTTTSPPMTPVPVTTLTPQVTATPLQIIIMPRHPFSGHSMKTR